jgi:hypothetical protein
MPGHFLFVAASFPKPALEARKFLSKTSRHFQQYPRQFFVEEVNLLVQHLDDCIQVSGDFYWLPGLMFRLEKFEEGFHLKTPRSKKKSVYTGILFGVKKLK